MIDWLAFTFVKSIGWVLCRLPPGVAVGLGERLGLLGYWLRPTRRQVGLSNLRAAFDGQLSPVQARRIIRNHFKQLGAGVLELLRLPVIDRAYMERYVACEDFHYIHDAVASKRRVVLLTGHLGNWELQSIYCALQGHPIVALARVQRRFPRLYTLLVSYRESKGCVIVPKGGAVRRLISALEAGQPIGVVGDQSSRQGIFVNLFGRPALFPKGSFEMALNRDAVIIPVFIRRVRGPFHKMFVGPPLQLVRHPERSETIRRGIEQFAELLTRHIKEDPEQWLWTHKRWKHTPARRVLVLDDGKLGHLKQSLAIVEALREKRPDLSHHVVPIRYRSRLARGWCLLWSWWRPARWAGTACLQSTLTTESARGLLSRYADLIISCGSSTVPVNHLWASENRSKSLVIMNPAPLPLKRFDLVIAPRHDGLPRRRNVVQTVGAISRLYEDELRQAAARLQRHPKLRADSIAGGERARGPAPKKGGPGLVHRHPVIAVFLGGDTPHYELTTAFADALIAQVMIACEAIDGWCLLTTSRRTAVSVERLLAERLTKHPRCRLLLVASRDPIDGTMEGMLGSADVALVTGESISMVSEACASGRHVVVVEPPLRHANRATLTRHQRFLHELVGEGYARMVPVPEISHTISRIINDRRPAKRLEQFTQIREAVQGLI